MVLFNFYYSNQLGHFVIVPLGYASVNGVARIFQQVAKAREQSDCVGAGCGAPPFHGWEIFENLGMKSALSCSLKAITMGLIIMKYNIYNTNPYNPF